MPEETPEQTESSSPANQAPRLDYRTPPEERSPCRPLALPKAASVAAAAEQASAKATAPAAACRAKVPEQAKKAQAEAPIPTHEEESRRIPDLEARELAPAARPPCLVFPCREA